MMVSASSGCDLPMILIGKSQGKSNSESFAGFILCSLLRFLRLGALIRRIQRRKDRTRLAGADRLAVEPRDRQHFLGGRTDDDLVGPARFGFGDLTRFKADPAFVRQLFDQTVANSFEN